MEHLFDTRVEEFVASALKNEVKMLLVGGAAVNFHGYQRHSADVDFWIDTSEENLQKLIKTLNEIGFNLEDFPKEVKNKEQNVAIKISPIVEIELITRFSLDKTFEEAYQNKKEVVINEKTLLRWNVISYEDLIESKLKSQRPKDLLDIQELQRRNKK
jgi:hypothetical protein